MKRDKNGRFAKGARKPPNSGRRKGTLNKATCAWKEFVTSCADDTELQEALEERCLARPDLLLRVAEHAVGRPRQSLDVSQQETRMFTWPDDSDVD